MSKIYHRKSIRIQGWDYSSLGLYFITINTHSRISYFGEISNQEIFLTEPGKIAKRNLESIQEHHPYTRIQAQIIMPDHVHFLLEITPLFEQNVENKPKQSFQKLTPRSVPTIVSSYKASVTRDARKLGYSFSWQRGYYEKIIRTKRQHQNTKNYILQNVRNYKG